jgi:hypothetical protein
MNNKDPQYDPAESSDPESLEKQASQPTALQSHNESDLVRAAHVLGTYFVVGGVVLSLGMIIAASPRFVQGAWYYMFLAGVVAVVFWSNRRV